MPWLRQLSVNPCWLTSPPQQGLLGSLGSQMPQCHRELPGYPFDSMPVSYLLKEASAFYSVCTDKQGEAPSPVGLTPSSLGASTNSSPLQGGRQSKTPHLALTFCLCPSSLPAQDPLPSCWDSFVFFLLIRQELSPGFMPSSFF